MLQTKFVRKLKVHILCSVSCFENRAVYETVWKIWWSQTGHKVTMQRRKDAICMLDNQGKNTNTHFFFFFLLPLALQPAVGFGLSNNTSPFFPIYNQLSPSSHCQHLEISFSPSFPGSSFSSRTFQFLSEDGFGHPIVLSLSLSLTHTHTHIHIHTHTYEGCPESIQPFWISREPVV